MKILSATGFHIKHREKISFKKIIFLFFISVFLISTSSLAFASNTWSLVGDLKVPRDYHAATTLNATEVLVSGGSSGGALLNSAEIFNLNTGLWKLTAKMNQARQNHTAVLLDDGRVLVAGGSNSTADLASTEIYDPSNKSWSTTASMSTPRANALITKLQDGRILVSSGSNNGTSLSSAEIYDPASNTWSMTGIMIADATHTNTAVLLNDGRVFIKGHAGYTNGPFIDISPSDPFYPEESPTKLPQLFNPVSNSWSAASPMIKPKLGGTSILLSDGDVLIVGGDFFGGDSWGYPVFYCNAPAEIYNPSSDSWITTGMINTNGLSPSKVSLLPDGKVLAFGPSLKFNPYSACGSDNGKSEIFDPATGNWSVTDSASTNHGREGAYSSLVDGKVLTIGGGSFPEIVEIYTPSGTPPETPPRSEFLHISDLDGEAVENNNYPYFTWVATTTFTVMDENDQVIEGANVSSISYSSQSTPDVCTTNSLGQCSVQVTASNSDRTIQVTNISKSLMTYDSAANSDPDGDSDGTSIIIQRLGAPDPWIYVSDLDGSSVKKGKRRWQASVSIQIVNWNGDPEYYTEIIGTWSGGASGTATCRTDTNGLCQVTSDWIKTSNGTATFTVTDVVDDVFVYDPSLNEDPDGDSNGTSITVSKP